MDIKNARQLQIGSPVRFDAHLFTLRGIVTKIEPHHRHGFWVTFRYTNARGKVAESTKKHTSIEKDHSPASHTPG
jgi:hypothetical protein